MSWVKMYEVIKFYSIGLLFLSLIAIGAMIILNRRDQEKRTRAMQGVLYLIGAFILILLGAQIAASINGFVGDLNSHVTHEVGIVSSDNPPATTMTEDMGFVEKLLVNAVEFVANSVKFMRDYVIGTDTSLQTILFEAEPNVLVDQTITKDGITFNLFDVILSLCGVIIYVMVLRTAIQMMKYAIDQNEGVALRESIFRWGTIPLMIAATPAFYYALTMIAGNLLNALDGITFSTNYLDIYNMSAEQYGLGIAVAKIYMLYLEFKMWTMMLFRMVVINAIYVASPLAISLSGHPKEFDSFNVLLNLAIKFIFYPFYYALAFVICSLVLNNLPNGSNPIVIIVVLGMVFRVADLVIMMFEVKKSVHPTNNSQVGNGGMVAATTMAITSIMRSSKGGSSIANAGSKIANSAGQKSTIMGTALNAVKNGVTATAKNVSSQIGQGKGFVSGVAAASKIGGAVGRIGGGLLTSGVGKAGLGMLAGGAVFAATGNPMAALGVGGASASTIGKSKQAIQNIGGAIGGALGGAVGIAKNPSGVGQMIAEGMKGTIPITPTDYYNNKPASELTKPSDYRSAHSPELANSYKPKASTDFKNHSRT